MGTYDEIERLLMAELNDARTAYELSQRSGLAMQGWVKALREFSNFVVHGKVPDRFKDKAEIRLTKPRSHPIRTPAAQSILGIAGRMNSLDSKSGSSICR
jgi:hypothetical protein